MKKEEIIKFAKLARVGISDEEAEKYTTQFVDIMAMLDQINEVEVPEKVVRDFKRKNIMREDEIVFDGETRDRVVKEFPQSEKGYLKTQKILNNN